MESVLVGVDQSTASRRAVEFVLSRARINGWRVRIVHVINWSPYTFLTPEELENRPNARRDEIAKAQQEVVDPLLEWVASEKLAGDVDLTSEIRHGRPSEVLSDLAVEEAHDMIVVARTGQSDLRNAIFGSTASRLVQHAPVPTLVVP
jgi:nucleotide-binding universal stress UspA family protein